MSTKIPYCTKTWNVLHGCTACSDGCSRCWALRMTHRLYHAHQSDSRFNNLVWHPGLVAGGDRSNGVEWTGRISFDEAALTAPQRWRDPQIVFLNSMSDTFHPGVTTEQIVKMFRLTDVAHQHTYLVVTKRIERMAELMKCLNVTLGPRPNVYLLGTVCNQSEADAKLPALAELAAAGWNCVVNLEPMIGPVHLAPLFIPGRNPNIKGVILGGESGPGARWLEPDWVRSVRDQCASAGTMFYFKQTSQGQGTPTEKGLPMLDGRIHDELPWEISK